MRIPLYTKKYIKMALRVKVRRFAASKKMKMTAKTPYRTWVTVPTLPCAAIEETLTFWETLGFEITYKQTRPYQYGVVTPGGSELHFGRVKGMEAASNLYNGCLVVVPG